jgi:hypothetical protein
LTAKGASLFREKVEALKGLEGGELAAARGQLREVRGLLQECHTSAGCSRWAKPRGV